TGDGRLAEVRLYSRDGCGARRAATLDPLETGGRGAGAGGRRRDTARAGRIAPGGPEHHRARPRPARLAVAGWSARRGARPPCLLALGAAAASGSVVSPLGDPLLGAMAALRTALLEVGEPHMLIGGTAVILRGVARVTDDIDAAVWAEHLDVEHLLAVLARHEIVG